ncbi:MAG: hypothetical protein M1834_005500 [Cirrosporium novae-zelandiae]|nr:MAG: hypothetical protein M1834_005500 [Cirrosporium novae-zelandiae]
MSSESFDQANKLESNAQPSNLEESLEQMKEGGHMKRDSHSDRTLHEHGHEHLIHELPQRTYADGSPLALLGFSAGIFLISSCGLAVRGVATPNILVGMLVFFSGIAQFVGGIFCWIAGNTYEGTVFPAYGAFNLAYGIIYVPGSGIMDAYTDSKTGELNDQFAPAVALFLWAWFIVTFIFVVGAIKTNWVLFIDLVVLDLVFMLLAIGNMNDNTACSKAGSALGYVCAFLTFILGAHNLWAFNTPIRVPVFPMPGTKRD